MNRGDALQWGFELDTDGKQWNVTVHGSQRPDFTFGDIEAFIEWLREEHEGLLIGRMARRRPPEPIDAMDAQRTLNKATEASLRSGVDAFLKEQNVEPPFVRAEEDPSNA